MSAVVTVLKVLFMLITLTATGIILWRMIHLRRLTISLLLFLIMPIAQLFMLYALSFDGWSVFWVLGLLFSVVSTILILLYTVTQEKKTAALEQLRETRHRIELEKSHYEAVLERVKELDEIRRDFKDKLEAVAGLTRSGDDPGAGEGISALAEKINRTKENPYCAIPVINAILTEKEAECRASGIDLAVDLKIPGAITVGPMHLCSVFSNILDNAIAACKELPAALRPVISLSAITDGDYLIIKAINPANKPNRKPSFGRGYGMRILTELTKQYDGDMQNSYQDGTYTIILSLAVKEAVCL